MGPEGSALRAPLIRPMEPTAILSPGLKTKPLSVRSLRVSRLIRRRYVSRKMNVIQKYKEFEIYFQNADYNDNVSAINDQGV